MCQCVRCFANTNAYNSPQTLSKRCFYPFTDKRNRLRNSLSSKKEIEVPLQFCHNMSCAASVTWTSSSLSRKKEKQNQKSNLCSHSYSVVDLWDACAARTATSASFLSFLFAFILVSLPWHLPTRILLFHS